MSPHAARSMREHLQARTGDGWSVARCDPSDTHGMDRKHARKAAAELQADLAGLQQRLTAEAGRALLVVLQGMDTSGKDGTIKHVMSGLNPQGVRVHAFKAPTPAELRHDFLWRVRRELPRPGFIGIFNRSHYEDVLIARVDELAPAAVIEQRYEKINRFEAELERSGVTLIKVLLHISFEEQRQRLVARLENADKHWKFDVGDVDKRAQWCAYQDAYDIAVNRCSTPAAPWYVVPADHKWFRDYAISRLVVETLHELDPRYPRPPLEVPALLSRLRRTPDPCREPAAGQPAPTPGSPPRGRLPAGRS